MKIVFLPQELEKKIYMLHPEGFEEKWERELGLQVNQISIWTKIGAKMLVQEI